MRRLRRSPAPACGAGLRCVQCGHPGDSETLFSWEHDGQTRCICRDPGVCCFRMLNPRRALSGRRLVTIVTLCVTGMLCAAASEVIQARHGPAAASIPLAVAGPLLLTGGLVSAVVWWAYQALKSGSSPR